MIGTCGKCGQLVGVLRVAGGCVADAHESGDSDVCSGSGLAPRGVLDTEAPAPVADVLE